MTSPRASRRCPPATSCPHAAASTPAADAGHPGTRCRPIITPSSQAGTTRTTGTTVRFVKHRQPNAAKGVASAKRQRSQAFQLHSQAFPPRSQAFPPRSQAFHPVAGRCIPVAGRNAGVTGRDEGSSCTPYPARRCRRPTLTPSAPVRGSCSRTGRVIHAEPSPKALPKTGENRKPTRRLRLSPTARGLQRVNATVSAADAVASD